MQTEVYTCFTSPLFSQIDIHGVARGGCQNCTECPQFISIPGNCLVLYSSYSCLSSLHASCSRSRAVRLLRLPPRSTPEGGSRRSSRIQRGSLCCRRETERPTEEAHGQHQVGLGRLQRRGYRVRHGLHIQRSVVICQQE